MLGEILARSRGSRVHFWRDKQKHEVDFVLEAGRKRRPVAVECKSAAAKFDPSAMQAFRRKHPEGEIVPYFDFPDRLERLT